MLQKLLASEHSITMSVVLHLLPGLLATLVFVPSAWFLHSRRLPVVFANHIETVVVLLPVLLGILWWLGKDAIAHINPLSTKEYILYIGISLGWAVLVFALLGNVLSGFFLQKVFFWLPEWITAGGGITHPELYSKQTLRWAWVLTLITTSIAAPIAEELYFRGFLLPRLSHIGIWAPVLTTVLFAVYHFWSPWLVVVRVIAIFPMVFLSWKTQNIYIAIWTHVLLNLVGDSILTVPQTWK